MSKIITKYAAIIIENNKFLLVRQKGQDYFKNLGGKLENSETPEECLKREVEEEIGVNVEDTTFYWQLPRTKAVSDPTTKLDIYLYFIKYIGKIKSQGEIEEVLWISTEDFKANKYKLTYQIQDYIIPKLIKDSHIK